MREPQAIRITFLRSRHNPRGGVIVDENLDQHSIDQLRRWARRSLSFVVIDPETGQDVTRVLMA
jgi:hypothetical protein